MTMKPLYIIVDCNFGDQGVDIVCASHNREKIEKRLSCLERTLL